jgi:hypothetical protein
MILPMTFFGGFLVAIILFTAKVGVINMILIKGVLVLQIAMVVAKMVWAAKEFLSHKSHDAIYVAQPSTYYPVHHNSYGPPPASSNYGWNRRQEEEVKDYNPSPIQYSQYNNQISPYYQQSTDYGQPQYQSGRSIMKRSSSAKLNNSQESNQIIADSSTMTTHLQDHRQPIIMPIGRIISHSRRSRLMKEIS